jgi:4-hydroxy-3-methylbut-2-enyl diphosphate reductase
VALLPAVAIGSFQPWTAGLAFIYAMVMVFVRCAFFDILDVQGDLIVGKETIPIVLGEAKTRRLLLGLTVGLALLLAGAPLLGLASGLAWALILPVAGLGGMQLILVRGLMMPGAASEGLVDLNFWLAGALALAWAWV